jgi:hypothetical protein
MLDLLATERDLWLSTRDDPRLVSMMSSSVYPTNVIGSRTPGWWRNALLTLAAAILASAFFRWGGQEPFFDGGYYLLHARTIVERGLLAFADDTRSYGYPLFVAACSLLTDRSVPMIHFAVFVAQLVAYLGACWWCAQALGQQFRTSGFPIVAHALTVLNPMLLIMTTTVLTDSLSSTLVFVSVVASLPTACAPNRKNSSQLRRAALTFLASSFAVMLRPATVSALVACVLIWSARAVWYRDVRWAVVPIALVSATLPAIPQVYNNARAYGVPTPLIVRSLYREQARWGTRLLKYATVVAPAESPHLEYTNSFCPPSAGSAVDCARTRPLGYAATLLIHAFALVDPDYPFPYILNRTPWYRWPLACLTYAYFFLAAIGILVVWRSNPNAIAERFALSMLLLATVLYVALYLPTAVENRFGIPVYLLVGAAATQGCLAVKTLIENGRWDLLFRISASATVFIGAACGTSAWLQSQATMLH